VTNQNKMARKKQIMRIQLEERWELSQQVQLDYWR